MLTTKAQSGNVPPVGVTAASKAEIKVCNWQVAVAGLWLANCMVLHTPTPLPQQARPPATAFANAPHKPAEASKAEEELGNAVMIRRTPKFWTTRV